MDDNTKLSLIIGCTLAGAGLIVFFVLLTVCLCSRRRDKQSKESAQSKSTTNPETFDYSSHKPGVGRPLQPQFIRQGSQQWRANCSLATAVNGRSFEPNEVYQRSAENVDLPTKKVPLETNVPWYQRTLGRARQFFISRPAYQANKRDSGQQLVTDVNRPAANDRPASGVYNINGSDLYSGSRIAHDVRNEANQYSSSGSTESYNYGSQTNLIPNDNSLQSAHGKTDSFTFHRPTYNQVATPSHYNQPGQYTQQTRAVVHTDGRANEEFSIPRPVVTGSDINRQRISSVMPPLNRAPQRVEGTYERPVRAPTPIPGLGPQRQVANPAREAQSRAATKVPESPTEEQTVGVSYRQYRSQELPPVSPQGICNLRSVCSSNKVTTGGYKKDILTSPSGAYVSRINTATGGQSKTPPAAQDLAPKPSRNVDKTAATDEKNMIKEAFQFLDDMEE